jgi:caspase domain-containing protein
MGSAGQNEPIFHALLIGIDNYPIQALSGCVNDIDDVQRLLLESGLGATPDTIRRLASPRAGTSHPTAVAEAPATFANIRAALAYLASDRVREIDRVFLYYSGHGKQVPVTGREGQTFQREALVPVDFQRTSDPNDRDRAWFFDFEFNEALRRIAARTRQITVVLDCCHAAGSFRDGDDPSSAMRSLDQLELDPVPDPVGASRGDDDDAAWLGRGIEACQVVSACLAHESAREADRDGKRHGLLTRAFVAALDAVPLAERPSLAWSRIWNAMRADVVRNNSFQTPRIEGNAQRKVFAGPPVNGDPGIPVLRDRGASIYRIEAGSAAEITDGAELAIYGPELSDFPALGSDAERKARLGLVRISRATPDRAEGRPVGDAFEIPAGARGRVVKPATALLCSVRPQSPEVQQAVADSDLIKLVGPDEPAAFRFERHADQWLLIDDQHGNGDDAPILFGLAPHELFCARAALEHYAAYSLPLRMARRAAADLPEGLELRLLSCPNDLPPDNAQTAKLDEVAIDKGAYQVRPGAGVCVYVRNRSKRRLSVGLFDASADGRVQLLGDEIIEPDQFHVFWAQSNLGKAFKMTLDNGTSRARDRLVAIGRTSTAFPLEHLRNSKTFASVVASCKSAADGDLAAKGMGDGRDLVAGCTAAATERWTAAQAVIDIVQ